MSKSKETLEAEEMAESGAVYAPKAHRAVKAVENALFSGTFRGKSMDDEDTRRDLANFLWANTHDSIAPISKLF